MGGFDHPCCARCGARRCIRGSNLNTSGLKQPMQLGFDPRRNWPWRRIFPAWKRNEVPADFHLCPVCGLVWSAVDPEVFRDLVQARGSQLLKEQLGMINKPIMADDELDGPF